MYTDLNKASVLNGDKINLDKDCFFKISYNEKIKPFTIDEIKFEFEKQKFIGLIGALRPLLLIMLVKNKFSECYNIKLLTFEKTGAVMGSTTSLPETIGG